VCRGFLLLESEQEVGAKGCRCLTMMVKWVQRVVVGRKPCLMIQAREDGGGQKPSVLCFGGGGGGYPPSSVWTGGGGC